MPVDFQRCCCNSFSQMLNIYQNREDTQKWLNSFSHLQLVLQHTTHCIITWLKHWSIVFSFHYQKGMRKSYSNLLKVSSDLTNSQLIWMPINVHNWFQYQKLMKTSYLSQIRAIDSVAAKAALAALLFISQAQTKTTNLYYYYVIT